MHVVASPYLPLHHARSRALLLLPASGQVSQSGPAEPQSAAFCHLPRVARPLASRNDALPGREALPSSCVPALPMGKPAAPRAGFINVSSCSVVGAGDQLMKPLAGTSRNRLPFLAGAVQCAADSHPTSRQGVSPQAPWLKPALVARRGSSPRAGVALNSMRPPHGVNPGTANEVSHASRIEAERTSQREEGLVKGATNTKP